VYSSDSRQYILKKSGGQVYNFYYDKNLGLCYTTLTKRNTWTEPVSLQKNLHPGFYVDIDDDDVFHILTQDANGSIFCSSFDGENIKTVPVLGSKMPSAYNKHLSLVPFVNNVHVFYVIEHNDSNILAHQSIISGKVSNPRVIDYVYKSHCPYSVISDRTGGIYAFYQSSDGRHLQLGYKKYTPERKFWSEFTPVTRFRGDCEYPKAVVDDKNIIHLCYQRRGDKLYELVYQQKIPDRNLWSHEIVIHSSAYPFTEHSVTAINGVISVFWVRDDIVYYSSSNNGGITWSKPARQNFTAGRQLVCIVYSSNDPYEREKVSIREIPGCFVNGYRLAFYQDTPDMVGSMSPNELRNMIIDTLKLLKGGLDELKETQEELKNSMQSLNASQQILENDVRQSGQPRTRPVRTDSQEISAGFEDYFGGASPYHISGFHGNVIENIKKGVYMEETFLTDENIQKEIREFRKKLAEKSYKLDRRYSNKVFKLKRKSNETNKEIIQSS